MNWQSVVLITCALAPLSTFAQDARSLASEAGRAYDNKQYAECSRLYSAAIEKGSRAAGHRYNGACCSALAGRKDEAFALIEQAIAAGYTNADHFVADTDFASLHADPRWNASVEKLRRAQAAHRAAINSELATMKEADQAVRRQQPLDFEKMAAGDAIRYKRVKEIIAAGQLKVAEDYHNAALIMQHGYTAEDYELAHRLATRAVELDPEFPNARWLSAAAKDRWLWAQGKPQIYGTQFQSFSKGGLYTMEPFDRDAVTDEQRQEAGVRTLAESEQRLEIMNKREN